ncbi:hypothetical protein BD779DRAFT_1473388 [Infundibulicybe gibba]|nr:hypothetical protein BD779DRAFT_1473388 [Infundibulicybe gibba]
MSPPALSRASRLMSTEAIGRQYATVIITRLWVFWKHGAQDIVPEIVERPDFKITILYQVSEDRDIPIPCDFDGETLEKRVAVVGPKPKVAANYVIKHESHKPVLPPASRLQVTLSLTCFKIAIIIRAQNDETDIAGVGQWHKSTGYPNGIIHADGILAECLEPKSDCLVGKGRSEQYAPPTALIARKRMLTCFSNLADPPCPAPKRRDACVPSSLRYYIQREFLAPGCRTLPPPSSVITQSVGLSTWYIR